MNKAVAVPKKIRKDILKAVGEYLDIQKYRVFVFGSRATGRGSKRSDIDVGIDGPTAVPRETMAKIKSALEELPTLYTIEVVDFKTVTPEFKKVAFQKIESLTK